MWTLYYEDTDWTEKPNSMNTGQSEKNSFFCKILKNLSIQGISVLVMRSFLFTVRLHAVGYKQIFILSKIVPWMLQLRTYGIML